MDYQKEILKMVKSIGLTDRKAADMCGIEYQTYRRNKAYHKLTKKHYETFVYSTKMLLSLCKQITLKN